MKISLFQGIVFGVFGLAAVIGIFVFATHNNSNSGSGNSIGTVVIWGTLPKAGMQAGLMALTQTNQDFKGVSYVQKDPDTLPSELANAIATGNAPDLILASQEELLPLRKLIAPIPSASLSAATFTSTFTGGARIFTVPGDTGYYGIPFVIDPLVLYSNRNILSSNGIAKPPATWEELTGLVPHLAVLTPNKQITRGLIALGTYDNVHDAKAILSSLFLQTGVPISRYQNGLLTANLSTAAASGDTQAGRAVLNFYTQFADPSKVSYTWNASLPDSEQAFASGDLALYLGYVSEAPFLSLVNPNLDFAVSQLPQPQTAQSKNAYGRIYAFMMPRGAQNSGGAFQAAALLTSSQVQDAFAEGLRLAPATLNALSTPSTDPILAVADTEALYTFGWLSPATKDTDSVFSSMINSVITGRLTTDRALVSGEGTLTPLLQQ